MYQTYWLFKDTSRSGYNIEDLIPYLASIPQVMGRVQIIDCGQNFNVIVDYAHTPDGYEKIYEYINSITEKGRNYNCLWCSWGKRL